MCVCVCVCVCVVWANVSVLAPPFLRMLAAEEIRFRQSPFVHSSRSCIRYLSQSLFMNPHTLHRLSLSSPSYLPVQRRCNSRPIRLQVQVQVQGGITLLVNVYLVVPFAFTTHRMQCQYSENFTLNIAEHRLKYVITYLHKHRMQ